MEDNRGVSEQLVTHGSSDMQRLADSFEALATGLRRIRLDASARRKHHRDGQVWDTTGNPSPYERRQRA